MAMDAGKLNRLITILRPSVSRDLAGQKVQTWEEHCKVYAQIRCTSVKTANGEGTAVHQSEYRFYIRSRSDLNDTMRVKTADNRTFQLTANPLDWQEDDRWMTLVTQEVQ